MRSESLAVVLTLHNRPANVLERTLDGLLGPDIGDTLSLVVVDDGSDAEHRQGYQPLRKRIEEAEIPCEWIEHSTLEHRPETYHIDGHNNPAYVNNVALQAIAAMQAPRCLLLSSDVVLAPQALETALIWPRETIVSAQIVDSARGAVLNSSRRPWPMCWFVLCDTEAICEVGFDEEYLKGMAFEDNDFMGRLFLRQGHLAIDDAVLGVHQAHPQTAYSDKGVGFRRSEQYTREKWGGVPFRGDTSLTFELHAYRGRANLRQPEATSLRAVRE